MKHSSVCLTICVALVLVCSILITPAWAPPENKPEKISVTSIKWDPGKSWFVTGLSAQFGVAQAGEHTDFIIYLNFEMQAQDKPLADKLGDKVALKSAVADPVPGQPVPLAPAYSPWTPGKDWYGLKVNVTVTAELRTANENIVGTSVTKLVTLVIDAPTCSPVR